jgi:penicillin-insensitive murein endopeptidase
MPIIASLHRAALVKGHDLWRVIFDSKLQPYLVKTKYGAYLKKHIQFSKKRSWVRHDEHYHVDFDIPCKKISANIVMVRSKKWKQYVYI